MCSTMQMDIPNIEHRVATKYNIDLAEMNVIVRCLTPSVRRLRMLQADEAALITIIMLFPPSDVSTAINITTGLNTGSDAVEVLQVQLEQLTIEELASVHYILESQSQSTLYGDPHLVLAHGGVADFRGVPGKYYNFLSATGIGVNVRVSTSDFRLNDNELLVHGTFVTEVHLVVARTYDDTDGSPRMLIGSPHVQNDDHHISVWASEANEHHTGGSVVNMSCALRVAGGSALPRYWKYMPIHTLETCADPHLNVHMEYSTLTVRTLEWVIQVTIQPVYDWSSGARNRLDIQFKHFADSLHVHGIVGQSFVTPRRDGRVDKYPSKGEFTTSAMAEGAIDGTASEYIVDNPYGTSFRYSHFSKTFDATKAHVVAASRTIRVASSYI